MHAATTLLVTTDPSLIVEVQRIHDLREQWRLEVCGRADKACAAVTRDEVGLVLIHLTADADPEKVLRLTQSLAGPRPALAALVCDEQAPDAQSDALACIGATGCVVLRRDLRGLAHLMDTAARQRQPGSAAAGLAAGAAEDHDPFFGYSETGEEIRQLRQVVGQDTTVLLTGETGTGKTLLARRIHELSPRRDEPFLVVDCGALSASLIESEMFGHVRGAFTGADRDRTGKFAAAGSGTLVLDEINSLHPSLQSKLLRAVEDRVFEPVGSNKAVPLRARLVAVTNTPLQREVDRGRFRPDLYYRLNVVGFELPPLRERRGAIAPLAAAFLAEFAARSGRAVRQIAADAAAALGAYDWPGNVRELRNAVERGVALCDGGVVRLADLPKAVIAVGGAAARPAAAGDGPAPVRGPAAGASEEQRIQAALHKHRNNRQRAAAELGMSRVSLYKKLHKYGLM